MATKTFLDLCTQLIEDAGISGEIITVSGQKGEFRRVVGWIQRAVTQIEGVWFDWDFLHEFYTFNTVAGVSDYTPPADLNLWDNATAVIVADEVNLDYIMWSRKKLDPTMPVAGDPYQFTVLPSKSLRIYDTPTLIQAINIEYWRKSTILSINTDEPAIPEQFREIIVAKALQFYANYESADEVKAQSAEVFAVLMRQLESHSAPSRQARDSINTGADIVVMGESTEYDF